MDPFSAQHCLASMGELLPNYVMETGFTGRTLVYLLTINVNLWDMFVLSKVICNNADDIHKIVFNAFEDRPG